MWCAREFHVVGRGTLAPWAPPRELVDELQDACSAVAWGGPLVRTQQSAGGLLEGNSC
jgi:hypothetical protein